MKTFLTFLLAFAAGLLFPVSPAAAQSRSLYDWAWVARLGATTLPGGTGGSSFPPSFNQPESLAADAAGNVLIAGLYDPDIIFGAPTPRYQNSVGPLGAVESSYVAKYTPAGTLGWSLNLTSNGDTRVTDAAMDAAGNSYVIGRYYQQLRVDGTTVALAGSSAPSFLAKIGPTGTLLWAITIEPDAAGGSPVQVQRLAVDAVGNSVVQGEFEGSVTVNGTTFAGARSTLHAIVLRYDQLGVIMGGFAAYTTGSEQGRSFTGVTLAPTGEAYVSGQVFNSASLRFGTLPAVTGPASVGGLSYGVGFVVRLDAALVPVWMLTTSGASGTGQGVFDVVVGPQSRCYAVGSFGGGRMVIGPQSLTTSNVGTGNQGDIFLARIAPSGTIESLVGGGGSGKVLGMALGPQGEVTIATAGGLAWGNVRLPGATWPTSTTTGLVQLDAAGVPQRGWQAGGRFFTAAVAVDGLNRPVLAGTYFEASPFTFGTRQLASPYSWNTVIARTALTPLAIRQAAQVAGLEVYPNPARSVVEMHTSQVGPTQIQLLDALGRCVRTQNLSAGQTQVQLAGVAAGSYTLLVQQGEARSYRRFTIEP